VKQRRATLRVPLTAPEVRLLLIWAEEATRGFYRTGATFVTSTEEKLCRKLQRLARRLGEE